MSNYQLSKEYFQNLEYYKKMHVEGHKLSTGKIEHQKKRTTEKVLSFLQN